MAFGRRDYGVPPSCRLQLALWALLLHQAVFCLADNITNPMSIFYTRPDLQSPILTIEKIEPDLITPGYIFFGVYQAEQDAPLIYDALGNLVWNGFGSTGAGATHGIHVCDYKGEPHLCFFNGVQMLGYGKGHGVIMDKHYQIVKTIDPAGPSMTADLHEFIVLPGGHSALMTVYQPRAYDLSTYGIKDGMGWIQENRFQEVDIDTGKLIFEWRSLDHIGPGESWVLPATTEISGDGSGKDTPWDYFHINSIDKNSDGDYLISARHVSALYKISGQDGHIIWRLNGIKSDYKLDNFTFSSQHDARWISENATHTVLSLYDNASNGFNLTHTESRGMIIAMSHTTMDAVLVQDYRHPKGPGMIAKSQGNTQILPNGHVIQGWGPLCDISESLEDGTPIFSAWAAHAGMMIYRAYKANWTADPFWDPSIWSYSSDKEDTVFYASWNGATEVTHWRFYVSNNKDGPFEAVRTVERNGFETRYTHPMYYPYVYTEALNHNTVLRKSSVDATFSPSTVLRPSCDAFKCNVATPYGLSAEEAELYEEERMATAERVRLEAEAEAVRKAEEARVAQLAQRKKMLLQLAALSTMITGFFLLSRKRVRTGLLGVVSLGRQLLGDLLHGRGLDRFRNKHYSRLPTMMERQEQ